MVLRKIKNRIISREGEVSKRSVFQYCIDYSGEYSENKLIVSGWVFQTDGSGDVSISVVQSNGTLVHTLAERRSARPDVKAFMSVSEEMTDIGFVITCDLELVDDKPLFIHFSSGSNEQRIPLCRDAIDKPVVESLLSSLQAESKDSSSSSVTNRPVWPVSTEFGYWVELCGIYKERFCILRGWAADLENKSSVEVSVNRVNGASMRVLEFDRVERHDVLKSLKFSDDTEYLGFVLLCELDSDSNENLEIRLNSGQKQLTLPFISKKTNFEELTYSLAEASENNVSETKAKLCKKLGNSYFEELSTRLKNISELNVKVHVDIAIGFEKGCFVSGWIDDINGEISAIHLCGGSRLSNNLLHDLCYFKRADVNKAFPHMPDNYLAGFCSFMELEIEAKDLSLLVFDRYGKVAKVKASPKCYSGREIEATKIILSHVEPSDPSLGKVFERHIHPALQRVWQQRLSQPEVDTVRVTEFGKPISNPRCSVIVPLYGRYDFVLHQIAQFVSDSDFDDVELIYVLDDPTLEAPLLKLCHDVEQLFPISFKLVNCGSNLGYAGANNLGARFAKAETLLLLNSDVLPTEAGWLGRMLEAYGNCDHAGAMGVKLIFEDGSIQHNGMSFTKSSEYKDIWLNEHPGKGLPEWAMPQIGCQAISTVTAACLMVQKAKFNQVGGFSTDYILGDFEDSDLCLKLIDAGYQNYLLGTEKLYHLERQSQSLVDSGDWKFKLTLYNAWQHTQMWDNTIEGLEG
ncbi:glycosyltransferase family 2 protein [Ferrimonas balearica]|uniref:glycosyltransferase family 2 protein n=1 Tax=Ferrimonas balearica TaxID=44012 RepID=UPI001C99CC56|nr:glycosyltransferase family 2 protein [Ferrimonas balearica]MBY5921259.1 glycosyltransferase family 2 protein [Ferrimonas balearica]MBY5996056.1 glycosyltransferase family 2 protein [Ferrimonas balearica]